jgi:hypothetical protein
MENDDNICFHYYQNIVDNSNTHDNIFHLILFGNVINLMKWKHPMMKLCGKY